MQEIFVKLFDDYDEAFRYLLRYVKAGEQLVPYLAEKADPINLLVENFPKKRLRDLIKAAQKSCVQVAFPSPVELAPEFIKVLLIGSEYDLKTLAKELKEDFRKERLPVKLLEAILAYKRKNFRITYGGKTLALGLKTHVMGVLNVTPDSFSDGGAYLDPAAALERGLQMAKEGADVIDVGGESTRPGAEPVAAEEELRRVLPVVRELRKALDREGFEKVWISVDTYKAEVAKAAADAGAQMINDPFGLRDPQMPEVLARLGIPVILNHSKGTPQTWKSQPPSYKDVVEEVISYWREKIEKLLELGYDDRFKIVCDPGIGFGKLPEHNVEILKRFRELKTIGQPLAVGVSRKSFIDEIYQALLGYGAEPRERLFGSLGALAPAVLGGAHLVRVHDVKQTREFLAVLDTVKSYDRFYFG